MSRRTDRIGSQLLEEIARILREEVTDPRIRLVTLTRIDVSPDLRNAIVHYSTLSGDDEQELANVDDGLASAAPFLRRRAAKVMPMKRMPELRFRYDPSLSLGSKTLGLLREIASDEDDAETEPT
ncbi:MAG: 30S ribosome-binding factor RbfA [Myxococcota bacterium]